MSITKVLFIAAILLLAFLAIFFIFSGEKSEDPAIFEKELKKVVQQEMGRVNDFESEFEGEDGIVSAEVYKNAQGIKQKLKSKSPYDRLEAIEELAANPRPGNIELIEGLLEDPTPAVVIGSINALGRIGSERSVSQLIAVYEDNQARPDGYHEPIQLAVINSLGEVKSKSALPILRAELEKQNSLFFKNHVINALKEIGDPSVLEILEEYLNDLRNAPPPDNLIEYRFSWEESVRNTQKAIRELKKRDS